jgi:hypothetical protein
MPQSGDTIVTTINGVAVDAVIMSQHSLDAVATLVQDTINGDASVNAIVNAIADTGGSPGVTIVAKLPGAAGNAVAIGCTVETSGSGGGGPGEKYIGPTSGTLSGGAGPSSSYTPDPLQLSFFIPAGSYYAFTYGGGSGAPAWHIVAV